LPQAADDALLTVALVGRVVPIKDISTFLQAVHFLVDRFPNMRAAILGATDEQPDYYTACKAAAEELGLASKVKFSGNVDVTKHFPYIHVNVLTSLSESQPLSLLEAGAAGIPSVATDVGSCREILLGRKDEVPAFGAGGILTDVSSPKETAEAIATLLSDSALRRSFGSNMRKRVRDYYDLKIVDDAYCAIYDKYRNAPSRQMV
jgi:glycosyltransferase involved in cell wall biosynthesis